MAHFSHTSLKHITHFNNLSAFGASPHFEQVAIRALKYIKAGQNRAE
jgi:hypothetical protein